jgi:MFS superfamily sulfate permease-like transporter
MMTALPLLGTNLLTALGLLLVFVLLKRSGYQAMAFIGVLGASLLLFGGLPGSPAGEQAWTLALPAFVVPNFDAFVAAVNHAFLPQLALTLTNALFLTAVIAQEYYPEDKSRLTENRFALSSGAFNLLLAPFGAIPMCHGASGLAAYRAAGGRSGLPVIVLGIGLIALGIATGPAAAHYLALIPEPAFGVLLLITATYLVDPKKLLKISPTCRIIVGLVIAAAVLHSMLAGLAAGIVLEMIRSRAGKRFAARTG